MSVAAAAFLYTAIATSGGALAFLTGQRASGKTRPEVTECYEQAKLLESVARDLAAFSADLAKSAPDAAGRKELDSARTQLEDAISTLQRGADLVV